MIREWIVSYRIILLFRFHKVLPGMAEGTVAQVMAETTNIEAKDVIGIYV